MRRCAPTGSSTATRSAALAERYLGPASRAGEIFAANRDVLFDPKLLPIGVELKIPPYAMTATWRSP